MRSRSSLRTRVALVAALVAALAGLVSAGFAAILVDGLQIASEDRRLLDTATLMQRELATEGGDPGKHVDEEAAEIAPVGLRMAIFEHGSRRGGASDLAYAEREGCFSRTDASGLWRTCAAGDPASRIVVSTRLAGRDRQRSVLLLAVAAAALLSALVSALASRGLAGWALAPLTALGDKLEKVSTAAPADADLGEVSGSSEVEALRDTIRGLLERLGESMGRSQGFAAHAAHELRTPLATMMVELELASEKAPEVSDALERVRRVLGRLSVLVERLLSLASGSATLQLTEAVAMEDVVRDVIAARDGTDRARFETTFDGVGMVRGDEALLRIIVDNLIDNALKFAKEGTVTVRVDEASDQVRLFVRDEGPGVDAAEAERLLLPFTRGKETTAPGHGLGLSIAAYAAKLHGGDVRFIARHDGAELCVTLPAWSA